MKYLLRRLVICLGAVIQLLPGCSCFGWTSWGQWTICDNQCGLGTRTRTRECTEGCFNGLWEEIETCEGNSTCSVKGGWSAWSAWSECTSYCGGGSQTRQRACDSPVPVNSIPCPGVDTQDVTCNTQPCTGQAAGCSGHNLRFADNCYVLYADRLESWNESKQLCTSEGMVLLTLETQQEQTFIINKLQANFPTLTLWMGAINDQDTFRWQHSQKLVGASWSFWKAGFPDSSAHQVYTDINDEGRWGLDDAGPHPYACKDKLDCPPAYFRHGNTCYRISETVKSWEEAKADCEAQLNSSLLYMDSKEEVSYIKNMITKNRLADLAFSRHNISSLSLWTAGIGNSSEGAWFWNRSDVSLSIKSQIQDFATGEPNGAESENCLSMEAAFNYSWAAAPCADTKMFICKLKASVCGPPPYVSYAIKEPDRPSYVDGSTLIFKCFPGFFFPDFSQEKSINCLSDLTWDSMYPGNCTAECPIHDITHATQTPSSVDRALSGTVLNYTCHQGYFFKLYQSDSIRISCMDDGTWDVGTVPRGCSPVTCEEPIMIHGRLEDMELTNRSAGGSIYMGSIARLQCAPHYVLPGSLLGGMYIECQEDGQWNVSYSTIECEPFYCEFPPYVPYAVTFHNGQQLNYTGHNNITHGHLQGQYTPGTEVSYKCGPGYHFNINRDLNYTAVCENGMWISPDPYIRCVEDRCGDPPSLAYANITLVSEDPSVYENVTSYPLFTFVNYQCQDGFHFSENSSLLMNITVWCELGGYWNIDFLEEVAGCLPTMCPDPPLLNQSTMHVLESSHYVYDNASLYVWNTTVQYTCDTGFHFASDNNLASITIICGENGTWNVDVQDECVAMQCPPPSLVLNAVFDVISGDGGVVVENATLRNSSDFGNLTSDVSFFVNTSVVFTCLSGHFFSNETLDQSKTIVCSENGTWSTASIPEKCEKKSGNFSENATESTTFSSVNITNAVTTITELTIGPTLTSTGQSSTFTDLPSTASQSTEGVITHCPFFQNVTNADPDTVNTTVGAMVVYTCVNGTSFPAGGTNRTTWCLETGEWSSIVSACSETVVMAVKRVQRYPPLEAPGATVIGSFGLIILLSIVVTVVISDIATLQIQCRLMRRNVNSYFSFKSRKLVVKQKRKKGQQKTAEVYAPSSTSTDALNLSKQSLISGYGQSSAHARYGHNTVHPSTSTSTSRDERFRRHNANGRHNTSSKHVHFEGPSVYNV